MTTPPPVLHRVARPGGSLAVEVAGDGPLVVCLPGMGELRSSWRHTAPGLRAAGYRVATVDLRGHGDSDATFPAYDDVAAGTDALAVVEHLGGGPAVLVGSSMGAGAAAWAAAERPDLVAGLALVGPFVRDPRVSPLLRLALRITMGGPWSSRVWTSYLPSLYPGRRPEDLDAHLAAVRESLRRPGRTRAFRATTRTSHGPVEARLGEVRAPVLVVMGDADPDWPDPVAEGRWVADRLGGELLLVPGAGHFPHVQHPEVVTPALAAFLGRVAPTARPAPRPALHPGA